MQRRHNHVDRCIAFQGNDEFSQVRLLDQDAVIPQNLIKMNLLGSHGFGLDDGFYPLLLYQVPNPLHCLFGAVGMENLTSPLLTVCREFLDHLIHMIGSVGFGFLNLFAGCLEINSCIGILSLCRVGLAEVSQCSRQGGIIQSGTYFLFQFIAGHICSLLSDYLSSTTMAVSLMGPCTPTVPTHSISAVRLGPVTKPTKFGISGRFASSSNISSYSGTMVDPLTMPK